MAARKPDPIEVQDYEADGDLLSSTEAGELCGYTSGTIKTLRANGLLLAVRCGTPARPRWFFRRDDLPAAPPPEPSAPRMIRTDARGWIPGSYPANHRNVRSENDPMPLLEGLGFGAVDTDAI